MITLIMEAFFALVFVQSLIMYSRRRDTLQRDLALVFAPMTVLLVLEIIRRVEGIGRLPAIPGLLGITLKPHRGSMSGPSASMRAGD
jgi:hypothetical protein